MERFYLSFLCSIFYLIPKQYKIVSFPFISFHFVSFYLIPIFPCLILFAIFPSIYFPYQSFLIFLNINSILFYSYIYYLLRYQIFHIYPIYLYNRIESFISIITDLEIYLEYILVYVIYMDIRTKV